MDLSSEWVSMGDLTHADAAIRLAKINTFSGIVETRDSDGSTIFRHLVEPVTEYKVTSYRGDS
jgi:hypothetical protein